MLHRNGKSQWLAPWLAAMLEWGQGDKWTINNRCNCSKSACFKMFQGQKSADYVAAPACTLLPVRAHVCFSNL